MKRGNKRGITHAFCWLKSLVSLQCASSCKTICSQRHASLGIESVWHLEVVDTEAGFIETHRIYRTKSEKLPKYFTIKYTQKSKLISVILGLTLNKSHIVHTQSIWVSKVPALHYRQTLIELF